MFEGHKISEKEPRNYIKYVGFDMDGTIIDSMPEYIRLFGVLMNEKYKIDNKIAENHFRATAGKPTSEQISSLLAGQNIMISKIDAFREGNRVALFLGEHSNPHPFSEIPEVLLTLKEKGYKIFVSSGQQETVALNKLRKSDLIKYIDFVAGIKPSEPEFKKGSPHFNAVAKYFGTPIETFVKETIFIGDTPIDMKISQELHIRNIGRQRTYTKDNLLGSGAGVVLPNFVNLPEILQNL